MSIIPRKFSTDMEENKRLFRQKLLKEVGASEGFEPKVYSDTMGVPTIGYGYAFITKKLSKWQVRSITAINNHLPDGLQITEDEYEVLEEIARDVLNNSSVSNTKQNTENILFDENGNNRISLELTVEQAEKLFENVARGNINYGVKDKFKKSTGNNNLFNQLDYSMEMVALGSIVYQGPNYVKGNDILVDAIITDDRARAWFEIRYFSNNLGNVTNRRGWAHRKCKEAQLFGLYQDNENIKQEEAQRFLKLLNTKIFADKSSYTDEQRNRTGLTYNELKDMTALEYIRYYERVSNVDPTCAMAGNSRTIDEIIAEAKIKVKGTVLYELLESEENLLKRFYNKKEWEDETEQDEYIIYTVKSGDRAYDISTKFLNCDYTHMRKKDSNGMLTDKDLGNIQVGSILYLPVKYIKEEYNKNSYIKKGKNGYEIREDWSNYKADREKIIPRAFQSGQLSYNCQELSNGFLEKAVNIDHDKIYIPANDLVFEELVSRFKNNYKSNYIKYLTAMTGKKLESALLDSPIVNDSDEGRIENQELIEKLLVSFNKYLSEYFSKNQEDIDENNGNTTEIIYFSRQSNFDYFRSLDGVITIYNIIYYIISECYYILPEDDFLVAFNSILNLSAVEWAQVSSWTNTDIDRDGTTLLNIVSLIVISCGKVSGENEESEIYNNSLSILNSFLAETNYDNLDYQIQQLGEKGEASVLLIKHFENKYHNYFYEYIYEGKEEYFSLAEVPSLKDKANRGNIIGFAENLLVRFIEVQAGCEADSLTKNIICWYHRCSKLIILKEKGFYNTLASKFKETGLRIFPILDNMNLKSKWEKPVIDRLNEFLNPENNSYDDLIECVDSDYNDYLANNFDYSKHESIKNSDKELKERLVEKYKDYTHIVNFINSIDEETIELLAVDLLNKESIIRKIALNNLKKLEEIV